MAISNLQAQPAPRSRPVLATLWYTFAILLFVGAFLFVYSRIRLNHKEQVQRSSCEALLAQLRQALEIYRQDRDVYPPSSSGVEAVTKGSIHIPPVYVHRVNGVIQERILDPWGHPFLYRRNHSRTKPFDLYSVGPNGIDENGKGDDVTSGE